MRSRNYGLLGPGSMLTLLFSIETLPRFLSEKSKKPGFSPLSWMEKQSVKVEDTCYLLFESRYEAAFSIAFFLGILFSLFYHLGTSCLIGFCCLNPIITGNPDGFSTFSYPFVQNSGNN